MHLKKLDRFYNKLIFLFLISISFHALSNQSSNILPIKLGNKHVSEGSLLKINEVFHHIYRSSFLDGDHVGNDGVIAIRKSFDGGVTWSDEQIIAQGAYDYRNVRSVSLKDGRILSLFRIFDAIEYKPLSLNYIISDTSQENWTQPRPIPWDIELDQLFEPWLDNPSVYKEKKYFTFHAVGFFQLWEFEIEDNTMTNLKLVSSNDFRNQPILSRLDEPELAFTANNEFLVLFREEGIPVREDASYFYMFSNDDGKTFSNPLKTGVCNKPFSFSVAPNMINNDEQILIFGAFRSEIGFGGPKSISDGICIAELDNLDTKTFNIINEKNRPNPSNHMLYGYPITTNIIRNRFLVIFSEAKRRNDGSEDSDFYKFIFSTEDNFLNLNLERDFLENFIYFTIQENAIGQINGNPNGKIYDFKRNKNSYIPNAPFYLEPKSSLSDNLKSLIIAKAIDNISQIVLSNISVDEDNYIKTSDINNDGKVTLGDVLKLYQKQAKLEENTVIRHFQEDNLVTNKIQIENNFHKLDLKSFLIGDFNAEQDFHETDDLCSFFIGPHEILLFEESNFSQKIENYIYKNINISDLTLESDTDNLIIDNFQIQLNNINFENKVKKFNANLRLKSDRCSVEKKFNFIAIKSDIDADNIRNDIDSDIDGDGWINELDAFSWNKDEYLDTDGDGIGNFSDDDIDGDGTLNVDDIDMDGDGIRDTEDENAYSPYI